MTNSQRLAKVRACLLHWIHDQQREASADEPGSATPVAPEILRESILIRDEFYCGRHLYTADHHAIWFIEEDELKIYQESGELLCVLSRTDIDRAEPTKQVDQVPEILKLPLQEAPQPESQAPTRRAA